MTSQDKTINREKTIVTTGIIGIIANILLASFKALIGVAAHSTAMVLDAVNNFSDVLSSVVAIIGTKIASKKPDKKHPLGHGRVEYLAQMIIAALIIYAGLTAMWESIKKIINPVEPEHSAASLAIISVAIIVKIFLGIFVRKQGKKVKSDLLISSGTDALFQDYTLPADEVPTIYIPNSSSNIRSQAVGVHLVMEVVIQAIAAPSVRADGTPYPEGQVMPAADIWKAWTDAIGKDIKEKPYTD